MEFMQWKKSIQKNPSIENIFFEASKSIAKSDKPEAIKVLHLLSLL